jgi:Phage integrase family
VPKDFIIKQIDRLFLFLHSANLLLKVVHCRCPVRFSRSRRSLCLAYSVGLIPLACAICNSSGVNFTCDGLGSRLKQAEELLRIGMRPDGDTFVVTQTDGSPLQPRSITHEWVRLLAAKKLPRIRFHDLRHAHATHLLASGIHPKIASERPGHSKVGITLDLYSHVLPGMQEDAVAKLDAALKEAMAGKIR